MKRHIPTGLAILTALAISAHGAQVLYYWDMDTLDAGTPTDVIGAVPTTAGTNMDLESSSYGSAGGSGGDYLKTTLGSYGVPLTADVFDDGGGSPTAMIFAGDFSLSYWIYDDTTDGDIRGMRTFDSLEGTTVGLQLSSNASNIYNLRADDDAGGSVLSNTTLGALQLPADAWTMVVVNFDRTNDLATIYFNGSVAGAYALAGPGVASPLTGTVQPSQDLQIGCINGGGNAGGLESGALDDLAFYDGTLSTGQISGLAAGTLTPDQIPEPAAALLGSLGVLGLLRRKR